MSKTRKILSLVLAVVLVFALSVPAFANWEAEDNDYTQTWALSTPAATANDDEYTINVLLTTDYATGAVQFELLLTGDVVLTGVALGADYYADADVQKNLTSGKVALIPDTAGVNTLEAAEIDGVIAVLTVTGTHGTIAIKDDAKSETNQGGTLIAARVEPADLVLGTQYVGQEIVTVGAAVAIGIQPADLAIKAAYADSGIIIDTNKTFGGSYAGVVYGFARAAANTFRSKTYLNNSLEATNNGSLSIKASSGTAFCGTGTEITVLNADGQSSGKVYVVVIFGDLNGDAFINATDAGLARAAAKVASTYANNSLERMAANASVGAAAALMHTINGTDVTAITGQTKNGTTDYIGQANVAKQMAKFNNNYQ